MSKNWKLLTLTEAQKKDRDRLIQEGLIDFEPDTRFPKLVHPTWYPYFPLQEWDKLKVKLDRANICPRPQNVFRVFFIDINDVKSIWFGQDPYPQFDKKGPVHANGLAFCTDSKEVPFSLDIIQNHIGNFIGEVYTDNSLWCIRNEGVVLMNTALTCIKGSPGSHKDLWKPFMTKLISNLEGHYNPFIYVAMGKHAQGYVENTKHHLFKCLHPAALAYNKELKWDFPIEEFDKLFFKQFKRKMHWTLPF